MTYAVGDILGAVPAFEAKVGAPARELHRRLGDLDPRVAALHLEPGDLRLFRIKRVELSRQFQDAGLLGIEREGDDLIASDQHRGRRSAPALLALGRRFLLPPSPHGEGIQVREISAEGLERLRWRDRGGDQHRNQKKEQEFH